MLNLASHPCFNVEVKGECGRVHLPVAPKCNILCNYCNRKHDCVNESRPGVTSAVLTPEQGISYLEQVLAREPRITVAGLASPGDPFANPRETMETLHLVRERFPNLLLCLATNGLGLPPYIQELADLQVSHVSITVNAVDPEIGRRIYSWVRNGKVVYRGLEAAKLLLSRQLEATAGVQAGAKYVHTTVNGWGERVGLPSLEVVVVALKSILGIDTGVDPLHLNNLSALVAQIFRREVPSWQPVVGKDIFVHESGIHAAGTIRDQTAFETFPSTWVGKKHEIVAGKHSGSRGLQYIIRQAGMNILRDESLKLLPMVRERAIDLKRTLSVEELLELYLESKSQ